MRVAFDSKWTPQLASDEQADWVELRRIAEASMQASPRPALPYYYAIILTHCETSMLYIFIMALRIEGLAGCALLPSSRTGNLVKVASPPPLFISAVFNA